MAHAKGSAGRPPLLPPAAAAFLKRRAIQVAGLGGLALLGAAAAALASFHPGDPSPLAAVDAPARNWLGAGGAGFAAVALETLGLGAALLLVVPASWAASLVALRPVTRPGRRLGALVAGTALLTAGLAALPAPAGWPLASGLGGAAGLLLGQAIQSGVQALSSAIPGWVAPLGAAVLGAPAYGYAFGVPWARWRQVLAALGRSGVGAAGRLAALARAGETTATRPSPTAAPPVATESEPAEAPAAAAPTPAAEAAPPEKTKGKDKAVARKAKTKPSKAAEAEKQAELPIAATEPAAASGDFAMPPRRLLAQPAAAERSSDVSDEALRASAEMLEKVLRDFGVKGQIVKVHPGPVVTLYELEPAPGVKSSRVISLADDIARSMAAVSARVAVIPGRNVIGIELPNQDRETVYLGELLSSPAFDNGGHKLPLALGKTIGGEPVIADLARMPHLLVAGTTGSGKSVSVNGMILSLLYRLAPERCRLLMIDPKMLELSVYEGIPHLLSPVITDPKKAVTALRWVVREMEDRYRSMSMLGVRNVEGYNARLRQARESGEVLTRRVQTGYDSETGKPTYEEQPIDLTELPYIVVVVDEIADLMLVAGKDVEAAIQRLAQMARAAGIHIIMATQRPSVDVITGTIKANFPTRISFQVTSKIDSRTILGEQGAEQLLGRGDMLFMAGGGKMQRVHGPFVDDAEVDAVVAHLQAQGTPDYVEGITEESADTGSILENAGASLGGDSGGGDGGENDLYDRAVAIVTRERKASTSFVQRQLQIGYNRAARLIEKMEQEGVVSPANHVGKREVLAGAPPDDRAAG